MSKLFDELLKKRGVSEDFLHPKYEVLSGLCGELPDVGKAVSRILKARDAGEKVLIYGDYDVDGVTATAIFCEIMRLIGVSDVSTMLPDRFLDGYGMSERLVERAVSEGVTLVITVDCGSNNAEIIEKLANAKIDTVVTDHHELSSEVPAAAVAVVNPKRPDFRKKALRVQAEITEGKRPATDNIAELADLSGAGVVFMLAKFLADKGEIPEGQEKWLMDLAAIGTMCDSMPMSVINRVICYYGLIVLGKTRRPGLLALMQVAAVKRLSSEAVGFQIGPRLNAAGRMETAELALKLLTTDSKVEAAGVAEELNRLNSERRKQQQAAVVEIENRGDDGDPVLIVKGDWHEGVLGIIAGRLTERYKKPCFVLAEIDGDLKGSGRSFGEYNLAKALASCQELLISGGGHAAAAGVRLSSENYPEFCKRMNDYYKKLKLVDQERYLKREMDVATGNLSEFNLELLEELKSLEPWGEGNLEPVFLLRDVTVLDVSKMGADGKHLRMLVKGADGKTMKLVAFYAEKTWFEVEMGESANILITVMENEWQGTRSVEGRIVGIE